MDASGGVNPVSDLNMVYLTRGGEHYIFFYSDDQRTQCLNKVGIFAADKDLSFTWCDAAKVAQKIRQETE